MKKLWRPVPLFSTFALIVFFIAGCGKHTTAPASSISAVIGSTAWQSQFVAGLEPPGLNIITLIGYYQHSGDSSQLEIDITDSIPLNQPDPFFNTTVHYSLANGTTYEGEPSIGGHGSVTVTSWDTTAHKIIGTFQGVLYNAVNSKDSITVAGGQFRAAYTKY